MTAFGYGYFGEGLYGVGEIQFPLIVDEVAFESNPLDDPQVWTDVSDRATVRSFSRGRQSEGDTPDTGTSSVTFENSDRALDPENAASPYYPNILPMRRIRSRASLDGVTFYPLFTNFVDPEQGWQLNQVGPAQMEAIAPANDAFNILDTFKFDAFQTFPQQYAGQRVDAILDVFGWSATERDIDTSTNGQSQVQAVTAGGLDGVSALDAIQAAAANDNGVFYIDGRGYAIFHGRHRQTDPRYSTSQAVFSDAANWIPGYYFYDPGLTPKASKIRNDYRVTRAGGSEVQWENAVSIDTFGRRTETVSTLHVNDAEALNYAQYRVGLDKDPLRRYDEMTITPGDDMSVWLLLLTLTLGDRITVIQSPPGGGAADVRDLHIEAISATIGPAATARWTYRLSPASDQVGWVLGDAQYGLLGSTTVLTY